MFLAFNIDIDIFHFFKLANFFLLKDKCYAISVQSFDNDLRMLRIFYVYLNILTQIFFHNWGKLFIKLSEQRFTRNTEIIL